MPEGGEAAPDPLGTDPPSSLMPPAATRPLHISSGGETLLGVLHLPPGPGPHPLVVLLHGFPGNERNFDLAQVLRRAGYAAVVCHYRGSWGVGGTYAWSHVLEDSARIVAALCEPDTTAEYGLAGESVALVGHSLGGFAALMTAARDARVGAVASVAGFDLGAVAAACGADPAVRDRYVEMFARELLPLRGTSGEALVAELEGAGAEWNLSRLAPLLADRPVLLVGTARDPIAPTEIHHEPVVATYRAHPVPRLEQHVFTTDHSLSDHRVALARTVLGFLSRAFPRMQRGAPPSNAFKRGRGKVGD
ncbi:alpha/beta fold hydrolase (plasmid) [Streptomyces canus]|uniref:alpha/beta hydrolase family protein n=1 Tax=Streptomyces canus TaxID=58343 RepID=UPI002F911847|nr:alpha/beta fold hydrolase [Streptomyces canus]